MPGDWKVRLGNWGYSCGKSYGLSGAVSSRKRPSNAFARRRLQLNRLDTVVAEVRKQFPNVIRRICYAVDEDWAHDPALFFRVLLKDKPGAAFNVFDDPRSQAIFSLCNRIISAIRTAVSDGHLQPPLRIPVELSEQAKRHDPEWD